MTTVTPVPNRSIVARLTKVIKMNFSNPWHALLGPSIALVIILAAAYLSYFIFGGGADGQVYVSPEFFLIIMLLILANQTINQHFSLALSYGISRKDFYLGSLLGFAFLAAVFALFASLLELLAQPNFFIGLGGQGIAGFGLVFWALLISQLIGTSITTLYLRYRKVGMSIFFISLGVIIVAAPFVATSLNLWDDIEALFIADLGGFATHLGAAGFSILLAVIGYLLIRRARPNKQ